MATVALVGPEVRVNTTTSSDQYLPTIAALPDGGYVVTWTSWIQDGSDYGIYAQRYDAAGNALGGETRVNTTTASDQYQPTITGLTDGGYVVTWMSYGQDGSGYGIYAQRFDAAGAAQDGEIRINTTTASDQYQPTITGLTDGRYVVTWMSSNQDGSGWGVYSRIMYSGVNEAPTAIAPDTAAVSENAADGTVVATLTTTDADTGETFTYTLANDAGGRFAIGGVNNDQIVVADGTLLDREAGASHAVQVQVTDSAGNTLIETVIVSVNDVNEFPVTAPADNDPGADSVAENAATGTLVGITAAASDADATTNGVTYSLFDDAAGRFAIDALSGIVTVANGALLNREAAASHQIVVRATSADGSFNDTTFTIGVTDENEFAVTAPVDNDPGADVVAENAATGTLVGITASASDADATTNGVTYSLFDDAAGRFAIDALSGIVTVANGALLNREAAASHNITVRATSADGSTADTTFSIVVSDVNEFAVTPPADTDVTPDTVAENAATGTLVGITASASDADATTSGITYSLFDDAAGRFAIDALSGIVTVANGALLNREAAASHNITVRATSADGSTADTTFSIVVSDVNEAPTDIALSNNTVSERINTGVVVGVLTAFDPDAGNSHTFTVDDTRFEVVDDNGVQKLWLKAGQTLDHGTEPTIRVSITATDQGGLQYSRAFVLDVFTRSTPVAAADFSSVVEDRAVSRLAAAGVLANDTDADGNALVVAAVNGQAANVGIALAGQYGTLTLFTDGSYTYTADQTAADRLAAGQSANDVFSYTTSDGTGLVATGSLTITVNGADEYLAPSMQLNSFGRNAGGWSSNEQYPRQLGDINGDGYADIVGFGSDFTYVALGNGNGSFQNPTAAFGGFGSSTAGGGWISNDRYPRHVADVNGDGRADLVGFGSEGAFVALSNGNGTFQPVQLGINSFGASGGAGGWASDNQYARQLADVNGDGRADVVGFGSDWTYVSLAKADGTFEQPIQAINSFGTSTVGGGWSSADRYPRMLGDVNGDGRADIVGFNDAGVYISLANQNGTFQAPTFALNSFGASASAGGWASNNVYPRYVADINGDGMADLVGFGSSGVYVSFALGNGSFSNPTPDLQSFATAAGGWTSNNVYLRRLVDVDGDGQADIVGFGDTNVFVSLSSPTVRPSAPTALQLSNSTISEANLPGFVVGTFSATDPDSSSFTYTLIDSADGAFTLVGNELRLNQAVDFEAIPDGTLTIQVRVTDPTGNALGRSFTINVSDALDGFASDGYVAGATVFHDANGDFTFTPGEVSATTRANGNFVLASGSGSIVLSGGTDLATGLPFRGFMAAPQAATVVSPLTTLLVTGATNAQVLGAFGLTGSVNLATFDPVSSTLSSDGTTAANGAAAIRAAIKIQNTFSQGTAMLVSAGATETAACLALATALALQASAALPLDLTSDSFIEGLLADAVARLAGAANPSQTLIDGTADIIAASNLAASGVTGSGATLLTGLTQVAIVAHESATNLTSVTDLTINNVVADFTGSNLDNRVVDAVNDVGDVFGPNAGETLNGTAGGDLIQGFGGNDTINGLAGADTLDGGDGDDVINAGDGADLLIGGAGDDILDGGFWYDNISPQGGGDFDRVSYLTATGPVTVHLNVGTDANGIYGTATGGGIGTDTLRHIEGVIGSAFGDFLYGGANNFIESFRGGGGDDFIDGGAGVDRAEYGDATAGVTINLAAGTVNGVAGGVGTDTLRSVEQIGGSDFDDVYDARGFGPTSTNAGSNGTYNLFRPNGGNDTVLGNGATEIDYTQSTAAVTVDLTQGTVVGGPGVGTDTISGIARVRGSNFDDTLLGGQVSLSVAGTAEYFTGLGGNDYISGGDGYDWSFYHVTFGVPTGISVINPLTNTSMTVGIYVHLAAGVVNGDPIQFGTDTLRGIEAVRGSVLDDIYDATGFSNTSVNAGAIAFKDLNEFEGGAGNDIIIGNGNTRVSFVNATSGVTVDLSNNGAGTVTGDISVGSDTLVGGISSIRGSAFGDTFIGYDNATGAQLFDGRGGDDFIDGRGGFDRAQYHTDTSVTNGINVQMAAGTVDNILNTDNSVGTDTLRSIESVYGTDLDDIYNAVGFSGSSTNAGSNGTLNEFDGGGGNDQITGNGNTRVSYFTATGGATVTLGTNGSGTGTGDSSIGNDTFVSGVSRVWGSIFADTIVGNGGANTFTGDLGNDTMTGGAGNDTFEIRTVNDGRDTITDFTAGAGAGDVVRLFALSGFTAFQNVVDAMSQVGGNTVLTLSTASSVTFSNRTIAQFNADDFLFV